MESVESLNAVKSVLRRDGHDLSVTIGKTLLECCQDFIFGFQIAYLVRRRWWFCAAHLAVEMVIGAGDVRQLTGKGANGSKLRRS